MPIRLCLHAELPLIWAYFSRVLAGPSPTLIRNPHYYNNANIFLKIAFEDVNHF